MGNSAHLSHLGQHGKIISLCMHFIFFCGHYTHNVQDRSLPVTSQAYNCDLGMESQHFGDKKALPA
jgi:hypothetical protein